MRAARGKTSMLPSLTLVKGRSRFATLRSSKSSIVRGKGSKSADNLPELINGFPFCIYQKSLVLMLNLLRLYFSVTAHYYIRLILTVPRTGRKDNSHIGLSSIRKHFQAYPGVKVSITYVRYLDSISSDGNMT